jgi:hypothetical protein
LFEIEGERESWCLLLLVIEGKRERECCFMFFKRAMLFEREGREGEVLFNVRVASVLLFLLLDLRGFIELDATGACMHF